MDFNSLIQYENKNVQLTLSNGFWYRAKILSVTPQAVNFISEDGKKIIVEPSAILILIPRDVF